MSDLNEELPATEPVETPTPEPSVQEKALAAIDLGMTEEAPAAEVVEDVSASDASPDPAAADPAKPDAEPAKDEAKPDDKSVDVNAEAEALGIKNEKAKERFTALRNENLALHTALEAVGIKDVAELPTLVETARLGQTIVDDWASVGVDAEGYAGYLAYAQMVQATRSGDMKAAESAFVQVEAEYQALAKLLGKDVQGAADPLAAYPDLQQEVQEGDITRKRALELAAVRTQATQRQATQHVQSTTTQAQKAVKAGENALVAWEQNKIATDPTYMAKREALSQQVAVIRESLPPDKWAAATERLYAALPAPAAPAPAAKPTPGPVRPGRTTAPMLRENASALEAINFALDNA